MLEKILSALGSDDYAERLLSNSSHHEDAAIVKMPDLEWWRKDNSLPDNLLGFELEHKTTKLALAQTVDILSPLVNDPFQFGEVAATNALSDIYAMGGRPWSAMNILSFSSCEFELEVASAILNGGAEKLKEAGVVLAGGHTLEDSEIKYGLSVTGCVDPSNFASNSGLQTGDLIIITKPLGTGVLSTAIKGELDDEYRTLEKEVYIWASLLNALPAKLIRSFKLKAATDITGFGVGGHLMEMAEASGKQIVLYADKLPLMSKVQDFAEMGLLPAACHANRHYCVEEKAGLEIADNLPLSLSDLCFDPQSSGGIALAVPENKLKEIETILLDNGHLATLIAEVKNLNKTDKLVLIK